MTSQENLKMVTIDNRDSCTVMKQTGRLATMLVLALVCLPLTVSGQQPPDFPPEPVQEELLPSPTGDDNVSVLTRGPLHEAFAAAYLGNPEPVLSVNVQPPEPIDEIPPAFKPDGENIEWIPGYWAWDSEQNDFIWISGIWREVPPGQQWIPGYWADGAEGWQRISGFWTSLGTEEIDYLPMPPQSVENGPSSNPPGAEYFYVPGNWVYQANSYAWQAGYWVPAHQNWVWVPSQYYWTPRGCVFVAGYWDYEFSNRGLVFAPVRFDRHYHTRPDFWYTPDYVIDVDANLLVHLFVHTGSHNYYFGDFYGSAYANQYHPWYDVHHQHYRYDPLYSYYQVGFGGHSNNVVQWSRDHHEWFAKNRNARPPRTLPQQTAFYETARASKMDDSNIRLATLGVSIQDMAKSADSPTAGSPKSKLGKLTSEQRQQLREENQPYQAMAQLRLATERGDRRDIADVQPVNPQGKLDLKNWRTKQGTSDKNDQASKRNKDQPWMQPQVDSGTQSAEKLRQRLQQRPARPNDWPKIQNPPSEQKLPELPKENKNRKNNQLGSPIIPPTQPPTTPPSTQPPGNRGGDKGGGNKEGGKGGGDKGGGNKGGGDKGGGDKGGGDKKGGGKPK